LQRVFEREAGELNFVTITLRQSRWFIAKVAVPSQRRPQGEVPLLNERDHVIRSARLFRNANPEESKQHPGERRSGSGKEEAPKFFLQEGFRLEREQLLSRKRRREKRRRSIPCNRGMPAQRDAAGKRRGDRYGRQPHGTLCNLTRVSI
jgi:hypothetical protein